jgi:hypothetical protein
MDTESESTFDPYHYLGKPEVLERVRGLCLAFP